MFSQRSRDLNLQPRPQRLDDPWAPSIIIEDKLVRAGDSTTDIEVGVALFTALLLLNDLNRMAEVSEYENFTLMVQHSILVNS